MRASSMLPGCLHKAKLSRLLVSKDGWVVLVAERRS